MTPGIRLRRRRAMWLTETSTPRTTRSSRRSARRGVRPAASLQLLTTRLVVDIDATDANIVAALHAAYEPLAYKMWPERPQVDVICATPDGTFECNPALVAAVRRLRRHLDRRRAERHLSPAPGHDGHALRPQLPRSRPVHRAASRHGRRSVHAVRRVADLGGKVAAMCAPIAKVLREALSGRRRRDRGDRGRDLARTRVRIASAARRQLDAGASSAAANTSSAPAVLAAQAVAGAGTVVSVVSWPTSSAMRSSSSPRNVGVGRSFIPVQLQ